MTCRPAREPRTIVERGRPTGALERVEVLAFEVPDAGDCGFELRKGDG